MISANHKLLTHRRNQAILSPNRLAVAFAVLVVSAAQTNALPAKQTFTDEAIKAAVRSDLHFDETMQPYSFEVSSSQGYVTVSGPVDNLFVRRRAVKIAESVRGVRGVIDHISVTPESRPDEDIRKDILTALLNDPATDSYQVAVTVKDGVATLTGKVGAWAEAQLAQHLAEGVRGVKDIRNDLLIDYVARRTDAEMAADVRAALNWDIWVHGYPIRAEVKDGQVTLAGTVGSAIQRSRADADAWIRGVRAVQDRELKVDPAAPDKLERRRKHQVLKDAEIKQAVAAALRKDPRA